MANIALNARKRLERFGNPESPTNRKLRSAVAEIAALVCENYPLDSNQGSITLSRGYRIGWSFGNHHPWKYFRGKDVDCDHEFFWEMPNFGHPLAAAVTLAQAQRFAADVASGFLAEVIEKIIADCGKEAGDRFCAALRL